MVLRNNKVLLYSGGMDSYTLARLYEYDICLYFKTGSKYDDAQLAMIQGDPPPGRFIIDKRLDLGGCELDNDPTATVPARNLLFITLATYYGNNIHFGATKGSKHTDKDQTFSDMIEATLKHVYRDSERAPIEIHRPLGHLTKLQILEKAKANGIDVNRIFLNSFTCYTPTIDLTPCGNCLACKKKQEIIRDWHNWLRP